MAPTPCNKRPSRPSSPPTMPPPHRAKHKRKQEAEKEEEVEAEKALVKEKYPSRYDDDPALGTSKEATRRLFSLPNPSRIDENALSRLKSMLVEVSDDHESTPNKLNLSEIVAGMFQTERWRELLDNLTNAIHTNTETRQETALRVILCLPEKECLLCLPRAHKFWSDNYESIYTRFFRKNCFAVLNLFDSPNLNIQAFTFDGSVKFICLLPHLRFDLLLSKMVGWLQQAFRRGGQIHIVKPRIMDLVQVARNYTHDFVKSLRSELMTCMFEIAETADDNFLTCPAIEIILMLQRRSSLDFTHFVRELSKESKRRILENCVRLMFHIADVPSWYDIDKKSNEHLGISGNFRLGEHLLLEFCLDSEEDILFSFISEKIPQYLNSEDWQTRHAGVIAFAIISRACGPVI
ncbi:hypothetical protein K1719_029531 [Acacia pycnantha]|nr:hypothetical protein K1719_029531 [Acacia pycnantha]